MLRSPGSTTLAADEFDHVVHNVDIDEAAADLGALIE